MKGIIKNQDAQFMLLAGFIIGIGLVVTTIVLTSIIFEFNTALGAGNDPVKNKVTNLVQITKDETRAAYINATEKNAAKTNAMANFTNQTNNFGKGLAYSYTLSGDAVNFSWDISNWNNGAYANFTDDGLSNGSTNWTVIESVKNVTIFEFRNVSGSLFEVRVTNQTTGAFLWSMKLNGVNSITIKNSSGSTNNYNVDFSYISLLNYSWGQYRFDTNAGTDTSKISFLNGQNAGGRYNVTGNTSYGKNFTRTRDFILNASVAFSTSKLKINLTIPVPVPW